MVTYSTRKFVNRKDSSSTGSVVCYDGETGWSKKKAEGFNETFIEFADCQVKARLHRCSDDTIEDFVCKLEQVDIEVRAFINHLKKQCKS